MARPRRTIVPEWPKTYFTPEHNLSVDLASGDSRTVVTVSIATEHGGERVILAHGGDPQTAIVRAAAALYEARAVLVRALKRIRRDEKSKTQPQAHL